MQRMVGGSVLLTLAIPLALWAFACLRPGTLPNTRIILFRDGGDVLTLPSSDAVDAFLGERANLLAQRAVRLEIGVHEFRPTYGEVGARFEPEDAKRAASSVGRSSNPFESLRALLRSMVGAGNEVRWRPRIRDPERLRGYVESLTKVVNRPAIRGTWDAYGNPIAGIPSEELNVDRTIAAIEDALGAGLRMASASTQVIAPPAARVAFDEVQELDADRVATEILSQQETRYTANNDRAVNVELAAEKIHRQILLPGERFSFNATVGKRTRERGFRPAPEVRNGRIVDPHKEPCPDCIGGGVCQVAGTVHAAAFFAGLDIVDQAPHSRLPSVCYLPAGLDTRVAWDPGTDDLTQTKDFVVRNPYPFPVILDASARAGRLIVTLLGAMRPYRVDCCYRVDRHDAAATGEPGVQITRMRTVYKPEARVVERKQLSYSDPETCMSDRGWKMRCDICGT